MDIKTLISWTLSKLDIFLQKRDYCENKKASHRLKGRFLQSMYLVKDLYQEYVKNLYEHLGTFKHIQGI